MCYKRPRARQKLGDRIAGTFGKIYSRGRLLRDDIRKIREEVYGGERRARRTQF